MQGHGADIHLVSGKGGVGKTATACAIALGARRAGKKVLLCELDGKDQTSALLGVPKVGYALQEVFEDLFVVDINPRDALHEYVLLILKFEALYRAVFENRLVRAFVDLVPSLSELVMLGKIWFHAVQTEHDRRRFDVIVVDAPATGHLLALLEAPQAVYQTVPPGPMRDNAVLLRDMLRNPAQTQLHVVTTPEDSPVTEACTLLRGTQQAQVRLGPVVINRRNPGLPDACLAALEGGSELATQQALGALRARQARIVAGEAELGRLGSAHLQAAVSLPELCGPRFDVDALQSLAPYFVPLFAT